MPTVKSNTVYMLLFFLMAVVYGSFSSSSPDHIGVAEIFIGLCLLVFVGVQRPLLIFDLSQRDKVVMDVSVPLYVRISFLYLLIVPTISGVAINQNEIGNWVRDIIPLIYMFLPVLLLSLVRKHPEKWLFVVLMSLSLVGILFSLRVILDPSFVVSATGAFRVDHTESNPDHLMQDTTVNFVLAFFLCLSLWFLLKQKWFMAFTFLSIAFVPLIVVLASVLRAPVGLSLLSVLLTLFYFMKSQNKRVRVLYIAGTVILFVVTFYGKDIFDFFDLFIQMLVLKQEIHGISSRDLEAMAVLNATFSSVGDLLFGQGLGGTIANPIGQGAQWRFVHNMVMYFLFKFGIVGLLACLAYFYWLLRLYIKSMKGNFLTVLVISLVPALLISSVLEASYKSLSFGLVLLLLPLMAMVRDNPKVRGWI